MRPRLSACLVIGCSLLNLSATPAATPDPVQEKVRLLSEGLIAPDPAAKEHANKELLGMGAPAIHPLVWLATGQHLPQAQAIRELLPQFGPAHVPDLLEAATRHHAPLMEDIAIEAVARMGKAVLPQVIGKLEQAKPWRDDAWLYSAVLSKMGPQATEAAIPLLKHRAVWVRQDAVTLLATYPSPRVADALLEAMGDSDPAVRMQAAAGLGRLKDPRGVKKLADLLRDPSEGPREAAAAALGWNYQPAFRDVLLAVARGDPDLLVRTTAADALIKKSHDPVAARLGRRYRPRDYDPAVQPAIRLWQVHRLVLTGLAICAVLWLGARGERPPLFRGWTAGAGFSAVTVAGLGFYWSRLALEMSAALELALLLACIPATAFLAWMSGPTLRSVRDVAIGTLVSFVVPYLLGPLVGGGGPVGLFGAFMIVPYLLMLYLGVVLIRAWRMGWAGDPAALARFRMETALGTAAFYVGYGVGWLALWGYLGV